MADDPRLVLMSGPIVTFKMRGRVPFKEYSGGIVGIETNLTQEEVDEICAAARRQPDENGKVD